MKPVGSKPLVLPGRHSWTKGEKPQRQVAKEQLEELAVAKVGEKELRAWNLVNSDGLQ